MFTDFILVDFTITNPDKNIKLGPIFNMQLPIIGEATNCTSSMALKTSPTTVGETPFLAACAGKNGATMEKQHPHSNDASTIMMREYLPLVDRRLMAKEELSSTDVLPSDDDGDDDGDDAAWLMEEALTSSAIVSYVDEDD